MPSYVAVFNDDGSGNFAVTVKRGSLTSEAAAGTVPNLPVSWIDNQNAGVTQWNVTAATNASPIVVTFNSSAVANPLAVGSLVFIQSVGGNTQANGTFEVSAVGGSTGAWTATLKGSTGNAAYTSGGKINAISRTTLLGGALEAAKRAILNDRS